MPGPPVSGDIATVLRLKPHTFYDRQGWGQPVEAFSMLLPADWEVSGEVLWKGAHGAPSCMSTEAQLVLEARSADGLWGFDILPGPYFLWMSVEQWAPADPTMPFQLDLNASLVQPQLHRWAADLHKPGSVCRVSPSTSARALVEEAILPIWRPQSRIQSVEELPALQQQFESMLARSGSASAVDSTVQADVKTVRILTQTPAGPAEEALLVLSMATATRLSGHDNVSTHQQVLGRPIFLARYPVGRRAEADRLFATFAGSLRTSPRWQAAMDAHAAEMSRIASRGAIERSRIWAKTANEISDMQMEGWKRRQESGDRMQALTVDQIREVEPMRDPTDGTVYELPSHYGSYFTNRKGEILMSTNPVLEPTELFPHEDWTRMAPAPR